MIGLIYTKLGFRSQTQLSPLPARWPRTLPRTGSRHFELVSGSNNDEEKERLKEFQQEKKMGRFLTISYKLEVLWKITLQREGSERSFDFPHRLQVPPVPCASRHPRSYRIAAVQKAQYNHYTE